MRGYLGTRRTMTASSTFEFLTKKSGDRILRFSMGMHFWDCTVLRFLRTHGALNSEWLLCSVLFRFLFPLSLPLCMAHLLCLNFTYISKSYVDRAFEAGEDSGFGHIYDALALVYSNGKVLWIPPARIKASCPMDITNFPFDKQNCSLKLGSWTYSGEQVCILWNVSNKIIFIYCFDFVVDAVNNILQVNPVFYNGNQDFSYTYYRHNNVWELEKTYAVKHDVKYACCEETYPDLTFSVQLARRRSYYSYMLVVPGIIMALLLPVMFLLPVGRSEKFILGINLLLLWGQKIDEILRSRPPVVYFSWKMFESLNCFILGYEVLLVFSKLGTDWFTTGNPASGFRLLQALLILMIL